jgi:hypothetical protein
VIVLAAISWIVLNGMQEPVNRAFATPPYTRVGDWNDRPLPAVVVRVMELLSIITCAYWGYAAAEQMPSNACQLVYDCKGCNARLKPKADDCCVFCSYGWRVRRRSVPSRDGRADPYAHPPLPAARFGRFVRKMRE